VLSDPAIMGEAGQISFGPMFMSLLYCSVYVLYMFSQDPISTADHILPGTPQDAAQGTPWAHLSPGQGSVGSKPQVG
jgi:hypothetical protein